MTDFHPDRVQTLIDTANALLAHLQKMSKTTMSSLGSEYAHELLKLSQNVRGSVNDLRDAIPEQSAETGDRNTILRHESYGIINVSRISGGVKLFGTVQDTHTTFISLRIQRARADKSEFDAALRVHEDYGNKDRDIVEVMLSAAQWAELLSSVSAGTGVPCTLRSVRGREMAKVPESYQDNPDRIVEEFKQKMLERPKTSDFTFATLATALRNSKLSKKDQDIAVALARTLGESGVRDAEWVLEEFSSHAARLRAAHMVELDATITGVVQKLGLERLREVLDQQHVPAIAATLDVEPE